MITLAAIGLIGLIAAAFLPRNLTLAAGSP
jgi:hypothetical protein